MIFHRQMKCDSLQFTTLFAVTDVITPRLTNCAIKIKASERRKPNPHIALSDTSHLHTSFHLLSLKWCYSSCFLTPWASILQWIHLNLTKYVVCVDFSSNSPKTCMFRLIGDSRSPYSMCECESERCVCSVMDWTCTRWIPYIGGDLAQATLVYKASKIMGGYMSSEVCHACLDCTCWTWFPGHLKGHREKLTKAICIMPMTPRYKFQAMIMFSL